MDDKTHTEIEFQAQDRAAEYSIVFDAIQSDDVRASVEDVIELRPELDTLAELRRVTESLAEPETDFFTRS